jgi:hypothetical protein
MIFEYTFNNYFRWGFQEGKPFSLLPDGPADVKLWFDIKYGCVHRDLDTFRKESVRACEYIYEQAERAKLPVTLFISGGIDSEAMVMAWLDSMLPFTCTTIEFEHGLNQHEVILAKKLCTLRGIEHRIIQIDPFKLWYNPPSWMKPYRIESGLIAAFLYGIDRSWNYFQVFAGNPVIKINRFAPNEPLMLARKSMLAHTMMWLLHDHPSVSFFHMYSPEQMWHWLNDPLLRAWEKQFEGSQIYEFDQVKTLFYQMHYPEIAFSRPKWTGIEGLTNHINDLASHQWKDNRLFNPIARRPLAEVRAELKRFT